MLQAKCATARELDMFPTKDIEDFVMFGMLIEEWTRAQYIQISSTATEDEEGTDSLP